ncbi:voltage-gated sodium channel [Chrysochromulina tobinii]|uniref:Voltage-gated sodium channel n=1 Tax=Chrysochromulina tobinii TaxID=1460289 RepID=A0A0M0JXW6_9EUKA|nr:voltage-gated sodium channel [Chrysochromulina tobinii]|eukprot:KOO31481.1 voltage-gated sodium channel [Chrysochromulina sp. CCMP291]
MNAAARAAGIKTHEREKEKPEDYLYNLEGLEALDKVPPCTEVIGPSGRVYSSRTFGFLEVGHAPRRWAIKLVEWAPFDAFILVTILANCVTMAWNSPLDPPGTPKAHFIDVCEWVYLLIFTFEMLAKICAYGFVGHDGAYLARCMVPARLCSREPRVASRSSFLRLATTRWCARCARCARYARSSGCPGMPVLVNSILAALPKLSDVTLLFGLLVTVCGIFGIEQFKGELHHRCAWPGFQETLGRPELREMLPLPNVHRLVHRLNDGPASQAQRELESIGRLLKGNVADASAREESISPQQQRDFDTGVFCNPLESKIECPAGETCSYFDDNINYGATNFDNFGWASIQVFQTISFDGWTPTMYAMLNTTGQPLVLVYFLLLIVLGGFFIVNLFLALESSAKWITWIFIIEMGLKVFGMGCRAYWSDGWNQLDGTIVIMSIVEIVLTALFANSGTNLSFLRILRMLRVARMLRLMRSWVGLYKIISTVVDAVPQMSNVLLLMFLICTIFALLGMQLFGGQFSEEHGYGDSPLLPLPRYNFDYFGPALLSVFVLTTGVWFTPMLDGLNVGGPSAIIYYITATCIGTYILVNLLIAVLLELFTKDLDGDGAGRRLSRRGRGRNGSGKFLTLGY